MNLQEYQKQAKRTCPSLGSEKLDLAHMMLGIHSEYVEFVEATDKVNRGEELADMYWYFANYCTFRGYDLAFFDLKFAMHSKAITKVTSLLQDVVKKYIAYNRVIDKEVEQKLLVDLMVTLKWVASEWGLKVEDILEKNINKLKVRFPDKFTEEAANNRDLEAERKTLE